MTMKKYQNEIAALNEFLSQTQHLGDEGWIYLMNREDFVDPKFLERREYMKKVIFREYFDKQREELSALCQRISEIIYGE